MRTTRFGPLSLAATLAMVVACTSAGTEVVEFDASNGPAVDTGRAPPPGDGGFGMDRTVLGPDVLPIDVRSRDVTPNYDAFFAENPPPQYCGPDGGDGGPPPPLPGGTAECPGDLLREGCACTEIGQMRLCWPGLRVNRNRGTCRDGMTRCEPFDELTGRWGPCMNYVLPEPGVRLGPRSCQCFSRGRWEITNTSPCFITYGATVYAVSTYLDAQGRAQCPQLAPGSMPPPAPMAGTTFSPNWLTVDCAGQFELCYVMRAGNVMSPQPNDCVVGRACTMAWYPRADERLALPPLPAWTGSDSACARRFVDSGGYGEMVVRGRSAECQAIDDGRGADYVFNRVGYCPLRCSTMPNLPECRECGNGGSGMF